MDTHIDEQKRAHESHQANLAYWDKIEKGNFEDVEPSEFIQMTIGAGILNEITESLRKMRPINPPAGDEKSLVQHYHPWTLMQMDTVNGKFRDFNVQLKEEQRAIDLAYGLWFVRLPGTR